MSVLIFDPDSLNKVLNETVPAQLPDGHTAALVGTVDANGIQAVLSVKKAVGSSTLECDGVWQRDWSGQQTVGARVLWSF